MYSLFPDMCPNMFDFSAIVHKQFWPQSTDCCFLMILCITTLLITWKLGPFRNCFENVICLIRCDVYIYIYTCCYLYVISYRKWAPISKKWFPAVVSLLTFTGSTVDQYPPQFQKTLIINPMSIPMFNGDIITMLNDPNCSLLLTINTTSFDV